VAHVFEALVSSGVTPEALGAVFARSASTSGP